jgi:hypothetical protein
VDTLDYLARRLETLLSCDICTKLKRTGIQRGKKRDANCSPVGAISTKDEEKHFSNHASIPEEAF